MSELSKWLPENHIQVRKKVGNWQEAVKIASETLLKEQLITHRYVENMLESVENNGPYMVLADYFALMHARPEEGVNQKCMSLLVLDEAVDMMGKPIKIFLILAAKDSQSHLTSLQDIMAVFMDEEKFNLILSGNKKEIIHLFS